MPCISWKVRQDVLHFGMGFYSAGVRRVAETAEVAGHDILVS